MGWLRLWLSGMILLPFWSLSRREQAHYEQDDDEDTCVSCGTPVPPGDDLCDDCTELLY